MTSNIDVGLGRGKEGITVGKSFVYVGTICRQDKRLGRAWLGGVRIWSLYPPQRPPYGIPKKRVAIF